MSQQRVRQGQFSAAQLRDFMNQWAPYVGAGIEVTHVGDDFRTAVVRLTLQQGNQNFFGTHFGGSLSAMTNPFYVLLFANVLGPDYIVWDTVQNIRYILPGRGVAQARFELTERDIEMARERTANGEKYEPVFTVDIVDEASAVIATVQQTLYIRRASKTPA